MTDEFQINTQDKVEMILVQSINLYRRKSQMYGEAWRSQGYMGNVARVLSKASRIKNMLWRDKELSDDSEPIYETLMDLIVLAAFACINYKDGNRWGK